MKKKKKQKNDKKFLRCVVIILWWCYLVKCFFFSNVLVYLLYYHHHHFFFSLYKAYPKLLADSFFFPLSDYYLNLNFFFALFSLSKEKRNAYPSQCWDVVVKEETSSNPSFFFFCCVMYLEGWNESTSNFVKPTVIYKKNYANKTRKKKKSKIHKKRKRV